MTKPKRELVPYDSCLRIGKNTPEITRLSYILLRALPKEGTSEYEKLCEEIQKLTTTNCWFVDYHLAIFLTITLNDYKDIRVKGGL